MQKRYFFPKLEYFFCKIKALLFYFQKRAGETSPSPSPRQLRALYSIKYFKLDLRKNETLPTKKKLPRSSLSSLTDAIVFLNEWFDLRNAASICIICIIIILTLCCPHCFITVSKNQKVICVFQFLRCIKFST